MNRFSNVIFGQKAFVVNAKRQLLILRRKKVDIFNNFWDVPGGKVEDKDSLLTALEREIHEEVGMKLEHVILTLSSRKFQGDLADSPVVMRNIYLVKTTGEVSLSQEHSEYKWVEPSDLQKYEFPPDADWQQALSAIAHLLPTLDLDSQLSQLM